MKIIVVLLFFLISVNAYSWVNIYTASGCTGSAWYLLGVGDSYCYDIPFVIPGSVIGASIRLYTVTGTGYTLFQGDIYSTHGCTGDHVDTFAWGGNGGACTSMALNFPSLQTNFLSFKLV